MAELFYGSQVWQELVWMNHFERAWDVCVYSEHRPDLGHFFVISDELKGNGNAEFEYLGEARAQLVTRRVFRLP